MPPKRKAASAASEAISSIQAPTTRLTRSRSDASAKKPKLESTITLLKEGDQLPDDLSPVTTDAGEEVRVQDLAKESGLLIFFYPRANTPGCTTQACGFRDRYEEVVTDGWKVYGMSYDSPKAQTTWKAKYSLPYDLLCDPKGDVLKRLGVTKTQSGNGGGVKRSHVVIDKGGRIKSLKIGVSPAQSILQGIESMTGKSVPVTENEAIMNGGGQVSEPTNTVPATDSVPAVADTTPITTIQAEVTDTPIDPAPVALDSTPIQAEVVTETPSDPTSVAVDTTPLDTALPETTETIAPAIADATPISTLPTDAASLTAGETTELPVVAESQQALPPGPVEPTIPSFLQDQIAQLPVASMVDPVISAVGTVDSSTSFTEPTTTTNPLDPAQTASSTISNDAAESANHEQVSSFGAYASGLQQQL